MALLTGLQLVLRLVLRLVLWLVLVKKLAEIFQLDQMESIMIGQLVEPEDQMRLDLRALEHLDL